MDGAVFALDHRRVMNASEKTVQRDWTFAKAWLSRAVKGHDFGLGLPEEDRRALIVFLRTL